ncbi:Protein SRG1 [Linum perenne]
MSAGRNLVTGSTSLKKRNSGDTAEVWNDQINTACEFFEKPSQSLELIRSQYLGEDEEVQDSDCEEHDQNSVAWDSSSNSYLNCGTDNSIPSVEKELRMNNTEFGWLKPISGDSGDFIPATPTHHSYLTDLVSSQFNDGAQGVRMNYYPPCKESNKVMGITPHSDPGGLTLLTQVNDVQGLQIRKDRIWVPVVPIPGAFIINIGDINEMMSNGEYKSIEHRAVVNPEKERISIATFHSPSMKAIIGPIPELINEKNQAKYQSISQVELRRLAGSRKLEGGSNLIIRNLDSVSVITLLQARTPRNKIPSRDAHEL